REVDEVLAALVELVAVLVVDELVRENGLVWRATGEDDAEEELRVVPEAHLLEVLGDELGREPLLPVVPVLEPPERRGLHDGGVLQLGTQLIHGDEPLVVDTEDDLLLAAPADRVAVRVRHLSEELAAALQLIRDLVRDISRLFALEPAKPAHEVRVLVDADDDRRAFALPEREVLRTAARRDMDDACAFLLAHLVPLDDLVERHRLRGEWQIIEEALVAQT